MCLQNFIKSKKYSISCPGCISQSVHWSIVINLQMDRAYIEGVQRRVLIRIDEKLQKWQPFVNLRN